MNVGDVIKYHFPSPVKKDKSTVIGIISFFSQTVISIDCVDMTKLKITAKNFKNIEIIGPAKEIREIIVA